MVEYSWYCSNNSKGDRCADHHQCLARMDLTYINEKDFHCNKVVANEFSFC